MGAITSHVLDVARGRPAEGVEVRLERLEGGGAAEVGRGVTDADGRVRDLISAVVVGTYRLTFEVGAYFEKLGVAAFYPVVQVTFVVREVAEHYHVPVLLSPFGYSTYRGN